ncbi:MAG: ATP-binding protein [Deltaproteobacteria bacterium]|nr:ATP-binding protein [Deltaproteobacteria bacterium]
MVPEDLYSGRKQELQTLLKMLTGLPRVPVQSAAILGPGRVGTSEFLKRLYLELFRSGGDVIPFYYRFERIFHDPLHFVRDYLACLIRQYSAFQCNDPSLFVSGSPCFSSVQKLAYGQSDKTLDRFFEALDEAFEADDREACLKAALYAPAVLAEGAGKYAVMMVDHFHLALRMSWSACPSLMELYPAVMEVRRAPHLITGLSGLLQRDFLGMESTAGLIRRIQMDVLDEESALAAFLHLAERYQVKADPEAVRCELARFHGVPYYMVCLIRRARQQGLALTSAEVIGDLYFREIAGGEIAAYFEAILNRSFRDPFAKRDAVRIMNLPPLAGGSVLRIEEVAKRVSLDLQRVRELTESLIQGGLLEGDYGMVHLTADPVLADFLKAAQRSWLTRTGEESIRREILKESPDVPILTELQGNEEPGGSGVKREKISFGLVLPMVSETELVAARALEQVAERVDFPDEEIGKIRMALIEACINSFEHSGSSDGKIYITFTLDREKLTIVVEDKGRSFDPKRVPAPERVTTRKAPSRRGWGIELIKNLMDRVEFDDVAVGTRLRMIKYLPRDAGLKAEAG